MQRRIAFALIPRASQRHAKAAELLNRCWQAGFVQAEPDGKSELALEAKSGRLTKATIQKLAQHVLERWATPVRYRQQEKPLQEVIGLQAKRLAASLRGEGGLYRPFLGRW